MDEKRPFIRSEVEELVKKRDWESLREYDFEGADFRGVYFEGVDFSGADLSYANFERSNLKNVNFKNASLQYTDFAFSVLEDVDFRGADIAGADFFVACMDGIAVDETTSCFHMHCPEEGAFTGYKKAYDMQGSDPYIVELRIPAHALRSSATTNDCRCSEAEVISITCLDGTGDGTVAVRSAYDFDFLYKVGETPKVDNFDENRWHESAPGINFFMTREEAEDYDY